MVIPMYNAAAYVEQAVKSAPAQSETAELLPVEDGATDGPPEICQRLERNDSRVRSLRHPGGQNRGAGAARNLGIAQASSTYVAFLDADDFYRPGRFRKDAEVVAEHPAADGVCDAPGLYFQEESPDPEFRRDPNKRIALWHSSASCVSRALGRHPHQCVVNQLWRGPREI